MTRLGLSCLGALLSIGVAGCSSTTPPCALDASLDADQCATLGSMAWRAELPPSPGNAKADDVDAAYLGFEVFFDARFSSNQNVRCASCHLPENSFDDDKSVSLGLETVVRNSPTLLNAAQMRTIFWDGRADSLWSQPLFALENPSEMGFSRLAIAHRLELTYAKDYAAAFGPLPAFDDAARFPADGKPGDPAWDQMTPADQDTVNRVAANLGKALEAYARKLATGPAPFDAYLAHQTNAMSAGQARGMVAFVELGCAGCHAGPSFTDEKFHNLGVAAWSDADPDPGREGAIAILEANPFNLGGPYADGHPDFIIPTPTASDLGAFRTPSLRNVALSAPYGHNGRFTTLADMIAFHLRGGGRGESGFSGEVDPAIVQKNASPATIADIADFLTALNGAYPAAPWNNWPGKN